MTTMEVTTFLQIVAIAVGIVVGFGGLAATIWAVGKVRGVETSIDLLSKANDALRDANADLRIQLIDSEKVCGERIAKLEGQNQALLDGLGDKLAHAIADRLESTLKVAAQRIVDGIAERSEAAQLRFEHDHPRRTD